MTMRSPTIPRRAGRAARAAAPGLETSVPVPRRSSPPTPVGTAPPPPQRTIVDPCMCGHGQAAHEHYRPGSDCGDCGRAGCGQYRAVNSGWRRFLRSIGLSESPPQ
jgi:hypothetical protein